MSLFTLGGIYDALDSACVDRKFLIFVWHILVYSHLVFRRNWDEKMAAASPRFRCQLSSSGKVLLLSILQSLRVFFVLLLVFVISKTFFAFGNIVWRQFCTFGRRVIVE